MGEHSRIKFLKYYSKFKKSEKTLEYTLKQKNLKRKRLSVFIQEITNKEENPSMKEQQNFLMDQRIKMEAQFESARHEMEHDHQEKHTRCCSEEDEGLGHSGSDGESNRTGSPCGHDHSHDHGHHKMENHGME